MAIKVGNSYVTEAAYAHAQNSISQSQGNKDMLSELSSKFPNTNFSTNTQPFQGDGTNNIAISPTILYQMASSPEKRLEYEALIFDCNMIQQSFGKTSSNGSDISSHGFIIDSQGNLSAWCITKPSGEKVNKFLIPLPKDNKKTWLEKINEGLEQPSFLSKKKMDWRA